MRIKRFVTLVAASAFILALTAGTGFAQGQVKPKASTKPAAETIKGTIDFDERLGGYFIRGEVPAGELFLIDNQNPNELKRIKESGNAVTLLGHTTEFGAEHFFIEKIDGKKYSAAQQTQKKRGAK